MSPFPKGSFPDFVYTQLFITPQLDPSVSFTGQTVIVTGSNVGLGFSAAQQIAQRGAAKVVLAVRSISKGEEAATKIRASLPSGSRTAFEVWPLDLSSYQSVKDFATRANGLDRLDALLENAGFATPKWEVLEGEESMITVNVISTALLALLLLPKLRETAERYKVTPYLTIVSSNAVYETAFNERHAENIFDALADPKTGLDGRYALSKLLDIFFVRELAERTAGRTPFVIINTPNPGFCQSSLRRNISGIQAVVFSVMEFLLQRKTEVGARTLVHGCAAGKESHGKYLSEAQIYPLNPLDSGKWGDEEPLRKKLWSELILRLEKISPGISQNV